MSTPFVSDPYKLTVEEVMTATRALAPPSWLDRRSPVQKIGLWIGLFLGFLGLFAVLENAQIDADVLFVSLISLGVGLFLAVYWIGAGAKREMARVAEEAALAQHLSTVTVDQNGVDITSKISKQQFQWSAVDRLNVTDELLLMGIGATTVICPARAMQGSTPSELEQRISDWRAN